MFVIDILHLPCTTGVDISSELLPRFMDLTIYGPPPPPAGDDAARRRMAAWRQQRQQVLLDLQTQLKDLAQQQGDPLAAIRCVLSVALVQLKHKVLLSLCNTVFGPLSNTSRSSCSRFSVLQRLQQLLQVILLQPYFLLAHDAGHMQPRSVCMP